MWNMELFIRFCNSCFIAFLLVVAPVLMAQQVITGKITDAEDGTPIQGASVYIANTSIGIATDAAGNYSLTVPGRGSFEIVISHIGYQSVFHKIDTPKDFHQYNVSLEIAEIEGVTVVAPRTYRRRDVNLFWNEILGESPSKNGLEVVNPEMIYYYVNSNNVLKVICREPVEIINHQTGYRIRYILQYFEHDYRTNETRFNGMPTFEELIPQDNRQKERWEKKRKEIYAVSFTHFIRSLYQRQIEEDGFLLINREVAQQEGEKTPILLKDILQTDQDSAIVTIKEPLLLVCYAKPVTNIMIQNSFREFYIKSRSAVKGERQQQQIAIYYESYPMMELPPQQIRIFSDGTYSGLLSIQEHQNSIFGLSSKLPVEYGASSSSLDQTTLPAEDISSDLAISRSNDFRKIEENINAQLEVYPQEKIHLHTDRDYYVQGEKIWFKAYVTDANVHHYPTNSQYVYVELTGPTDTVLNRVMIARTEDDLFYGYLPLSEIIPAGDYTLRAYTRYMENLGDDYFFKKNIRVSTSPALLNREGEMEATRQNAEQSHGSPLLEELGGASFDVSFFPEGGNLPENSINRVAFKALDKTGHPENISGTVIDEAGTIITYVKTYHAGMGIINYRTEEGKKYYLKCSNENGLERQFDLPPSNPRAYTLMALSNNNNLYIDVLHSNNAPDISCYLLAHCRGTVIYFSEWDKERGGVLFPHSKLPAGVIQFVLFDEQMNPLSERLVFNKNNAITNVDFKTNKDIYQIRDKVVLTLSLPDSLFYSLNGHFSIAVTDDHDYAIDESTSILSSLLLTSELKGYIENPAWYLQDDIGMDLLMMTHGWRRYNIPDVIKGNPEYPQIPFQRFQKISGQVKTLTSGRPVIGGEILLMIKGEDNGFGITSSDSNGSFVFPDLVFPDNTTFYLQALNGNGRDDVRLILENESFPAPVFVPQSIKTGKSLTGEALSDESVPGFFIQKAEQRAKFDEDMWTLYLNEITVTATVRERNNTKSQNWATASSDDIIKRETIDNYKYPYVFHYLYLIKGVRVKEITTTGEILVYIREPANLPGNPSNALILIDGIERQLYKNSLSTNEVESIAVFSGGSAAAFGMRGGNGVVSITTRRGGGGSVGQIEKSNNAVYTPLGYQQPVEFYSPKYETFTNRQSPILDYRTTIFWKPDIIVSEDEGETTFEFYTSDYKTTYSVVIEGITNDGGIVRQVEKIVVSE